MNFNYLEVALKRSNIPVEDWLKLNEEQSKAEIDAILKLAASLLQKDITEIIDIMTL